MYDEWDFRAGDYKPRWCVVRQKMMSEGDPNFFGGTLHSYGGLVTRIKRQFEMMVPEMFRKVRKLEDGEEIDIDDLIEAIVDMKTGASPSDKFYWRRNKVQREVAAAFLIDTSASTAEAIDEGKRTADDWDAPDDPVEYMVWLRTRRGEAARRSYKRIIDVEKGSHSPDRQRARGHRRHLRHLRFLRLRTRERRVLHHQGPRRGILRSRQAPDRQGGAAARDPDGSSDPSHHREARKGRRPH